MRLCMFVVFEIYGHLKLKYGELYILEHFKNIINV